MLEGLKFIQEIAKSSVIQAYGLTHCPHVRASYRDG